VEYRDLASLAVVSPLHCSAASLDAAKILSCIHRAP